MKILRGAMLEIGKVLAIELIDIERHAQIVGLDRHWSSPSISPHYHGRARARHGPAEIGGDFALLHLATAALAVVVGVPALAVRSDRTGIIDIVAQLSHVLDHHVHAVRIALTQVAAAGIVGPPSAEANGAIADIVTTFALLAKTVVLELQHGGEGERVIGACDIHVLGTDAGIGPQNFARVGAGNGRNRPVLVV